METFPFDPSDQVRGEEAAAIIAAIAAYLAAEERALPPRAADRWTRAGRLEALGIPITAAALDRGWRV
jgi:hypothetical protein